MSKDDDTLFEEAMANLDMTVEPPIALERAGGLRAASDLVEVDKASDSRLFRDAIAAMDQAQGEPQTEVRPAGTGSHLGGKRAIERRIRRGQMRADATLDLHGLTEPQALEAVEREVDASRRQGHRVLLVICGRGLHSEGEAVLQQALMRWLKGPLEATVQESYAAGSGPGGRGAWYLVLRG